MYGKGEAENNTMHYLWSIIEIPSFTMILTDPGSEINIDWEHLQEKNSITFSKPKKNIFGISFENVSFIFVF